MNIDWSKAPEATTGAMQADFKHSEGGFGHVEFLPSHRCRNEYAEGPGAWIYHEKPKPWDGKGLPPVGTVCEAKMPPRGLQIPGSEWVWRHVEVVRLSDGVRASAQECLVFDLENTAPSWVDELRPIRTAEQIAAEEREKEVNRMVATASMLDKGWARKVCADLYDAGYRKQEATQ
jgi:hypothetical protein